MNRRPVLLFAAFACFASAGLGLGTGARAEDVPGSGFFGYTLTANASGLQGTEDEPSANSHPEGEGDLPHAQVSLTSGPVGYALSSVAWPGALAGNAGSLILLVKPDAPQQVKALNDPVRAEARTGEGASDVANDTVPGAHMAAKATAGLVTADAVVNGGSSGPGFGFGTTTASTRATLHATQALVTADSTAKDLSLASGVVRIGSVVSHAEGLTDGRLATGKGKTTVTGMTIGGVPVVVDDHGVTVDSQHQGIDPVANATLNSVLANFGMSVVLSKPTVVKSQGTISYDAGSLIVYWKPPGSVNVFTAHLGGARVLAAAIPGSASTQPPTVPSVPGHIVAPPVTNVDPPSLVAPYATPGVPPVNQPVPQAAPVLPQAAPPVVQAAQERLIDGRGLPVWAALLVGAGGALLVGGLWRVPAVLLPNEPPALCPLESPAKENP